MTAAIYALRGGKTVLIIEKSNFGGQIANSPRVENIPGTKAISGLDFSSNLFDQISDLGVDFELEDVEGITKENDIFTVKTNYGEAGIPSGSTSIGEIGTGAVIIEKGTLNSSGKRVYERFSSLNNLYTTDYIKNYGKEDKVLYKPEGKELSNSIYYSINFYY